jgi:hypothetical protein
VQRLVIRFKVSKDVRFSRSRTYFTVNLRLSILSAKFIANFVKGKRLLWGTRANESSYLYKIDRIFIAFGSFIYIFVC